MYMYIVVLHGKEGRYVYRKEAKTKAAIITRYLSAMKEKERKKEQNSWGIEDTYASECWNVRFTVVQ